MVKSPTAHTRQKNALTSLAPQMNLRKFLITLAGKLEMAWHKIDFAASQIDLKAGWYVTEFLIQGVVNHTPRIVLRDGAGKTVERPLTGFHAGRNRMLIYLPQGTLEAYSKSIEFNMLGRVPWLEGRARVLLICFRYLVDFFSIKALYSMVLMQFKKNFDLSSELLYFYSSAHENYLKNLYFWQHLGDFKKQLSWWCRGPRIAVLIEDESQRAELARLLVPADMIITASPDAVLPQDIDYIIPLSRTEHLRQASIFVLKRALKKAQQAPQLIYSDHDYRYDQKNGQHIMLPVFKPQPSDTYLHCFNYLGPAVIFARTALTQNNMDKVGLQDLLNDDVRYRLAIECFAETKNILHISEALFNSDRQETMTTPVPSSEKSRWSNITWQRHEDFNVLRASPVWQNLPSVDLVIPTRDGLAVLKPCIDSILGLTDYPNFKIIVVDNGSEQTETHAYFEQITQDSRVRVVAYPGEFNYSAINNFAVAQGDSDYVALVNNDIEAIHADWLKQMMVWASQPEVGIVGAKLLFGDGLVQHAGVIIGMGNAAGHIHRLEDGDSAGYQQRCLSTQNLMAVTAACLVTPRHLFEALGGLDEQSLKVAYNDIDFCLRVEKMGYQVVWTPEARLYHHESVSRGDDMSQQHIERYMKELTVFQKRWKTKGFVDKYYSRHLRISDEGVYPQISRSDQDELVYLPAQS